METLQNPKKTKAAKTHHCDYCGGTIIEGEIYMKSTHVFDGQIYDWKAHVKCDYLALRLDMHKDCDDGVTENDFYEIVTNEFYDLLVNLIPDGMRDGLVDLTRQIRNVELRHKIDYVYRHYLRLDQNEK